MGESQTEIYSRSETSFIRLPFRLTWATFPFLRRYVHIRKFPQSERRLVAMFYSLSTYPVCCHLLGERAHSSPRNIWLNQNVKTQAEGGPLPAQSPTHVLGPLTDD